jgi:hypothetical protein
MTFDAFARLGPPIGRTIIVDTENAPDIPHLVSRINSAGKRCVEDDCRWE